MDGTWRMWVIVAVAAAVAAQLGLAAYQAAERPRVAVRRTAPADVLQAKWRSPLSEARTAHVPCPARRA